MTEYITPELVLRNLANLPQLVFEVTDACNLKCKYCAYGEFYDDFDERENKVLPETGPFVSLIISTNSGIQNGILLQKVICTYLFMVASLC